MMLFRKIESSLKEREIRKEVRRVKKEKLEHWKKRALIYPTNQLIEVLEQIENNGFDEKELTNIMSTLLRKRKDLPDRIIEKIREIAEGKNLPYVKWILWERET